MFIRKPPHSGQGVVEYALIIGLVSIVSVLALEALGVGMGRIFSDIVTGISEMGGQVGEAAESIIDEIGSPGDDEAGGGGPEALYANDFSAGIDGLHVTRWKNKGSADPWTIEDGQLHGERLASMLTDISGTDYTVSAEGLTMSQVKNTWQGTGLFFRADNSTGKGVNGYSFEIEDSNHGHTPQITFSVWANGYQISSPLASADVPAGFDWEATHDYAVQVEGDTFTAYIDGEAVLTATDDLYAEGGAGFYTNAGTEATLDGFAVNPLP